MEAVISAWCGSCFGGQCLEILRFGKKIKEFCCPVGWRALPSFKHFGYCFDDHLVWSKRV